MTQPRLFPDHEDTQAAPVFTAPQTVALIAVMSQIVKAFFECIRPDQVLTQLLCDQLAHLVGAERVQQVFQMVISAVSLPDGLTPERAPSSGGASPPRRAPG